MDGSRLPLPASWLNEKPQPAAVLCPENGACWRWKRHGLEPCEGLCARRAFLNGLEYEVRE